MSTNLTREEAELRISELIDALYNEIPVGVGGKRKSSITKNDIREICKLGAKWAVNRGYGVSEDLALPDAPGAWVRRVQHCLQSGIV